jgi:pimeloyl-ACP methyl ester carboxylesterase
MMRDELPAASSETTPHGSRIIAGEKLRLRVHGTAGQPALIHLPGLHGDWTLLAPFRHALRNRARLVETAYPREPDWQLGDYATAVESALLERGIASGWILGESFSSQVAWAFLERQQRAGDAARFRVEGLILVGGFVRHPWPWGVRLAHAVSQRASVRFIRRACALYARTMVKRFEHCPGATAEFAQFVENRAGDLDRHTITRRYLLIAGNHPAAIARMTQIPVYHLSGAWDPIVPWWHVRPWLRRHCPGYRTSRILWSGGHNILLSSPQESAEQILAWAGDSRPAVSSAS